MNKIKIVHVAECGGGVDRFLKSLLKYSNRELFEINCIFSPKFKISDYEKNVDNISIINMKHSINPFYAIVKAYEIRKLINYYKPDIVVAHSSIAGVYTRIACLGLKLCVVYNPHGWSFNMINKNKRLFVFIEKIMSKFCDRIICISDSEKNSALINRICSESKLITIYNGIDFDEPNEEEGKIPNDKFVIGMVGRISLQKAPDIFVKMCSILKNKISNAYFIIVGDVLEGKEDEKRDILELADKLGVELNITGWVNNPINYMKKFDCGCLLSRWEGFGLVIPEYMYNQVPVVATNVDAIPYIIKDGVNGLLVEKNDYISASKKVYSIYQDSNLRNKLIANARIDSEKYDIKRTADEYENLYTCLINKEIYHDNY